LFEPFKEKFFESRRMPRGGSTSTSSSDQKRAPREKGQGQHLKQDPIA
jgi:hypothetical protein